MFPERFGVSILPDMVELALFTSAPEANASTIMAGDGWQRPVPGLTTKTASTTAAELIDIIGEHATIKLCRHFGGIACIFSSHEAEIVDTIGAAAAAKLKEYWGGGCVYIPVRPLSHTARQERVRELARTGLTRQAIARRLGMSERHVYRVLKTENAKRSLQLA